MPSFDVVSEVDMQEVRNAVDQANRELDTRFDFRGIGACFELEEGAIVVARGEEFQLEQMEDMLRDKLIRRKVETVVWKAARSKHRDGRSEGTFASFRGSIATRAGTL